MAFRRPNKSGGTTGAYLCQVTDDSDKVASMSFEEQKAEVTRRFKDVGWEAERVLKILSEATPQTFYLLEAAQAKSTGYCPSPLSGQGTTASFIGAYILAGCLLNTFADPREALEQYEKQMRPFSESLQKLPPGVPW